MRPPAFWKKSAMDSSVWPTLARICSALSGVKACRRFVRSWFWVAQSRDCSVFVRRIESYHPRFAPAHVAGRQLESAGAIRAPAGELRAESFVLGAHAGQFLPAFGEPGDLAPQAEQLGRHHQSRLWTR